MDISAFTDKLVEPDDNSLALALGDTYELWKQIENATMQLYPAGNKEWNYPGKKFGWSFRIKDKKRALIYLLPRDNYFKVAFVFGQKAFDRIMLEDVDPAIKQELQAAKVYAEGRGVRIDVANKEAFSDIEKLLKVKIEG